MKSPLKRMRELSRSRMGLVAAALLLASAGAGADELHLNFGGGPQFGADAPDGSGHHVNHTAGIDYSFYRHDRSSRSSFIIGMSYTYMGVNSDEFDRIQAFSIYPQLSMYPTPESWVHSLVPENAEPFFYVRFLGPSYISANRLGDRHQDKNFSFQAQVGVGASFALKNDRRAIVSVSWKHFSNANIFSDNDGIDLPVVLNFGVQF